MIVQPGAADTAAMDADADALLPTDRQGGIDRVRWPWLLSDQGILTVALLVAGVGAAALVGMWLIAGDVTGADRAELQAKYARSVHRRQAVRLRAGETVTMCP